MKKRILATILALAMTLSFVGCGSGQDTAATDSQETETTEEETVETEAEEGETTAAEPLRIGVSLPNQTNVFFLQIVDGIESAITGENDEVIITDANGDQNKQLNDVTDMINQGCNVIALSPINSDGVRATLEYCQDAGVPVIAFNVGVADNLKSMVETTIVSDNEVAGHLCAQALAEALNGEGKIVEVTFSTTTTCYQRQKGFEEEIAANYPGIEIVQTRDVEKATADYSQPIMVDFINANPDITGVFCINDPTARGAIAAIKEAGLMDKIKVVSVDGSDEAKEFIRAGEMVASAAQQPELIGEKVTTAAYSILAGETVETDDIIEMYIIDASNVDE
mgnify:FL=1